MLHDLGFLEPGKNWPPLSEVKRLDMYDKNRQLFECEHAEVYKEDLKRIARVVGNFNDVISYPVILNFQRLMSLKVADLLLGEAPQIQAGEAGSSQQDVIDELLLTSDLINTLYEAAIDISRYGDGLLYVRKGENGKGIIDTTQPPIWFPVVNASNVREVLNHVLAWTYSVPQSNGTEKHYLRSEIHFKGRIERRVNNLITDPVQGTVIGAPTGTPESVDTGLDDFAIIQIPNIKASGQATGLDDYTDIDSIVSELVVRIGQIGRILDKHADPSMQGPKAALTQDPKTGEWQLIMHNYFAKETKEDADVAYITWDGQLQAAFNQVEKLTNYLYTVSEMGAALLGDMGVKTGQIPSGSALRRLMMAPLAKVGRVRMRFEPALIKALRLCSKLGYKDLTDADISIQWQDGLPQDETEIANVISLRVASGTMSRHRAITLFDGLSEEDAEEEMERVMDEDATMNPVPNNTPQVSGSTQPNNKISGTV
jgi:hypothetical protein